MTMITQVSNQTGVVAANDLESEGGSEQSKASGLAGSEQVTDLESSQPKIEPAASPPASISSRAQKLQKLAEDFFPGGPST